MPILNIYKSNGKTLYIEGLRVFKDTDDKIMLAYDSIIKDKNSKTGNRNAICYIEKGSHLDKFFREMLRGRL